MVKTDEIREIGRATIVEFNLDENATLDFDSPIDSGEYLNDLLKIGLLPMRIKADLI